MRAPTEARPHTRWKRIATDRKADLIGIYAFRLQAIIDGTGHGILVPKAYTVLTSGQSLLFDGNPDISTTC
jgi:hypothetical protein